MDRLRLQKVLGGISRNLHGKGFQRIEFVHLSNLSLNESYASLRVYQRLNFQKSHDFDKAAIFEEDVWWIFAIIAF